MELTQNKMMETRSTTICINAECKQPITEGKFFCGKCLTQVSCKNCSDTLVFGNLGCENCGTPLYKIQPEKVSDVPFNEFEMEQKGDSKKMKGRFTDNAVSTLGNLLGLFNGTNGNLKLRPLSAPSISKPNSTVSSAIAGFESANIISDLTADAIQSCLQQVFQEENGILKLINSRLKHSGKLDQAIRISLLLLYTYRAFGRASVERKFLMEVLDNAKVNDANFAGWIANCDEISTRPEGLELSLPGVQAAESIILEFLDPNVEKGKIIFSKKKGSSKRKKSGHDDSSGKEKAGKGAVGMMEELKNEGFFDQKRKIGDIIEHCSITKVKHFKSNDLSGPLGRLVKDKKLRREKNSTDNQYEYFK
jgi:hypothetical protein